MVEAYVPSMEDLDRVPSLTDQSVLPGSLEAVVAAYRPDQSCHPVSSVRGEAGPGNLRIFESARPQSDRLFMYTTPEGR